MYQEIKDEILDPSLQPDANPRYTIKDNAGVVINDNVQIDMKTPIVQNPTPLNKVTLGNIQGDLYTQDRYNTPVYSGSAMTLSLPLSSYEKGKIIKITAPANLTNPTLNINGLGAKTVSGTLVANKRYILVYGGSAFEIIESMPIATQSQAQAGTENHGVMTPLRVKQAFSTYGLPSNNFKISTGTISDGGTIPQTTGYSNYAYFVSINVGEYNSYKDGEDTSEYDSTAIKCSVDQSTRKVVAKVGWWRQRGASSGSTATYRYGSATANYIEFAWN